MTELSPLHVIRELSIVPDLPETKLDQLAEVAEVSRLEPGETVFREAAMHSHVHWVFAGRITIHMSVPGHAATPLLTVGPGELVAWSTFFPPQKMTATGTAVTETVLLGFETQRLHKLCDSDFEIGYRFSRQLAWGLSRRLVATRLQLLDLFIHPSERA